MMLDVYADLFDGDLTAVAEKLDESVGKMWARGGADGQLANEKTSPTSVNASSD